MSEVLFLVRHAATDWSGKRYCGRTDLPLNAAGAASAQRLAQELAASLAPGIRVVCSPLRRARQTAEAIVAAVPGSTLAIDERWSETDFGIAEGTTYEELERIAPDLARRLASGAFAVDWPGGEGATALSGRVSAALHDVIASGEPAVVVSHGGPLRIAMAIATGQDPRDVVAPEPGHAWRRPRGAESAAGPPPVIDRTGGSGTR